MYSAQCKQCRKYSAAVLKQDKQAARCPECNGPCYLLLQPLAEVVRELAIQPNRLTGLTAKVVTIR